MQIEQVRFTPKLPTQKKTCAYARVSSGKDAMLHSLAAQVDYYSSLIRRNPEWEYAGVYTDEAITGTKAGREGFQRMLDDAKDGNLDLIITKSISRFARNTLTLLSTVRDLKAIGVDVFFEEQNIHTLSAEGEIMMTLLASFAQEESRSFSENMKWRIRKNFEAGIPWDGVLLGYRYENGTYIVVPEEAEIVRLIFSEYLSGKGSLAIAKHLGEIGARTRFGNLHWNDTSVQSILHNYTYTGNLLLQKTFRENHLTKRTRRNLGELSQFHVTDSHEAIISLDTYNAVQEEYARRRRIYYPDAGPKKAYPFTGKIVCGICGKNYRHRVDKGVEKWMCSTFNTRGRKACPSKQIPDSVINDIAATYGGPDAVDHIIAKPGNELVFILTDGSEHKHQWKDRSRRESWTPDMREKARQKAKEQIKCREISP